MRRPGATLAPIAALCAEQEFFIELEYINYSFKTRLISLPSISGFGYLYCSLRFIESIGHFYAEDNVNSLASAGITCRTREREKRQ